MDSNETVTLKPIGDVELWYAEADDQSWVLPLHVEWKQDPRTNQFYGLVMPGVCFYATQLLAIQAKLQRHSLEVRQDRWLLAQRSVVGLLKKAPGIHATYYYRWSDETCQPIPSHHELRVTVNDPVTNPKVERFDTFSEFVAHERHIPATIVSVVLTAVAQVGPRWLLQHREPIDLGFVRLVAFPFRANWKEIVMFKGKGKDLLKALLKPDQERMRRLLSMRFPAMLCSPQNTALRGGKNAARLEYTLEAVSTGSFDRAVERMEESRIEKGDYVAQHGKTIERMYEQIVDCLANYASKTQAAWALVRKGRDGGSPAFVPANPRHVDGVSLSDLPVDIVPTGNDFSVFAEQEGTGQRMPLPEAPASVR